MSIQGSGHYGVNKFGRKPFCNSVLNLTLVVARFRPDGSIYHILIPLFIFSSFDVETLFSYCFLRSFVGGG